MGTVSFAAALTVGSVSLITPCSSSVQDHAVPDQVSFWALLHEGTVALAAAATVGSLSVSRPASLEQVQPLPDQSNFCVLVLQMGTVSFAAALTVGSVSTVMMGKQSSSASEAEGLT
jgi:hypothetical protein